MKEQLIELRKQHPELRVLINTIIGEMDRVSKAPTEEESIRIVKKMIEENLEMATKEAKEENEFLETLIPKQLTNKEIEEIVKAFAFESIKECMNYFKENYAGLYDGKEVSKIFTSKK